MKFIKMHGAGNDYIFVNCFEEQVKEPEKLAVQLSDRHLGIGGDGLILVKPPSGAVYVFKDKKNTLPDAKMEIYNADGSRAEMCGNGIRCVAWLIFYYKKLERNTVYIETDGAVLKEVHLSLKERQITSVTVNMGKPKLLAEQIPACVNNAEKIINEKICADGGEYEITCVNMGNPHCVIFTDDIKSFPIEKVGKMLENMTEYFPNRINVEAAECINEELCRMRVWERGSGITLACGTGACAVAVAGALCGRLKRNITAELDGGRLEIEWNTGTDEVFMTGDVTEVFKGEV